MTIFIDTNVPMYVGGQDHPYREPCIAVMRLASGRPRDFITDAEVLQEILHRYTLQRRWASGRDVFESFAALMREHTVAIEGGDVESAANLYQQYPSISARDLLHAAVMQRLRITQIVSADGGFDQIAGIQRLDPAQVADWRDTIDGA